MIIKSLLFIIVCIFFYETYNNLTKMTEEYFTTLNKNVEKFIELSDNPDYNDISKTIARNCKNYPAEVNKIMRYKDSSSENSNNILDTPYYAHYKPIEYDKNRQYYWKRNKLVEEGIRRSKDDDIEIAKVQKLFNNESDDNKKKILQDELNLFNWRSNILKKKDKLTGISREKRDIISDYYPEEIGLQRPWIERHSHIPDYSY